MQADFSQISNIIQTATPFALGFIGFILLKVKSEFAEKELDRLKEESLFKLDIHRQLNLLPGMDESLKTVRNRQHEMSSKLQVVEFLVKQAEMMERRIQSIEDRMTDKARRLVAVETRSIDNQSSVHDLSERISSLEEYIRGSQHQH